MAIGGFPQYVTDRVVKSNKEILITEETAPPERAQDGQRPWSWFRKTNKIRVCL